MSAVADGTSNASPVKNVIPRRNEVRRHLSVTLSKKSENTFEELKVMTDAYSDSEVVRNALRIHHAFLQRQLAGETLFSRKADGSGELTQLDLFVAS